MLIAWLFSVPLLAIAVIAYQRMDRSSIFARLLVAGAISLSLPVALVLWVLTVGDPASVDAIAIVPAPVSPR